MIETVTPLVDAGTYTTELLDLVTRHCGLTPRQTVVADIASDSLCLSGLFLQHGYDVTVVRESLTELPHGAAELSVAEGSATMSNLPSAGTDLILSERAIYMQNRAAIRREFLRVLRPGGSILLITDNRVYSGGMQTEAYEDLLRTWCPGFQEKSKSYDIAGAVAEFFQNSAKRPYEDAVIGKQTLTEEAFLEQNDRLAIAPQPGENRYEAFQAALRDFFWTWSKSGILSVPFVCRFAAGRLA